MKTRADYIKHSGETLKRLEQLEKPVSVIESHLLNIRDEFYSNFVDEYTFHYVNKLILTHYVIAYLENANTNFRNCFDVKQVAADFGEYISAACLHDMAMAGCVMNDFDKVSVFQCAVRYAVKEIVKSC